MPYWSQAPSDLPQRCRNSAVCPALIVLTKSDEKTIDAYLGHTIVKLPESDLRLVREPEHVSQMMSNMFTDFLDQFHTSLYLSITVCCGKSVPCFLAGTRGATC